LTFIVTFRFGIIVFFIGRLVEIYVEDIRVRVSRIALKYINFSKFNLLINFL